jgi:hypothetical protein
LVNLALIDGENANRHGNGCLPPGELHSPGHCTHSMDHEHKEIDARARAEVAMGRDGRHDRSAFAHGPPHHLNHASSPLSPPSAAHPPSGPQSGTESTGRSPGVFPRGFLPPLPPWVQTYGMCVYIHYGFRQGAAAGRVAPGSAHAVRAPKGGCAREGARAQHQSPCALFSITLKKSSVGCCKLAKQARAVSEGVQRQPRQSRSPLVGRKCRPPLATRLPSSPRH